MEGRPPDEGALTERACAGDVRAFEELVRRYSEIAFRTAYLITGSAADAEEAAQDGFVNAYRALAGFRAGSAFKPWLLAIVANQARNRARAAGRRTAAELRTKDELVRPEDPAEVVVAREARRQLLTAVTKLPDGDRLVVGLRYFVGLSTEETAVAAGVPEGTVKSRLARALGKLRRTLDGQS